MEPKQTAGLPLNQWVGATERSQQFRNAAGDVLCGRREVGQDAFKA